VGVGASFVLEEQAARVVRATKPVARVKGRMVVRAMCVAI
jgi:hypothetical protein